MLSKQTNQLFLFTLVNLFLLLTNINIGHAQVETAWRGHSGEFLEPDCWTDGVPGFDLGEMGVHAIFAGVDEYDVGLETQYFSSSDFFFIDQTIANLVGGGQLLGNILTMNDDAVLKVGANTTCQMLRSDYFDSSMLIIEPEGRFTSGSPFRMHDDTVLLVDSAELSAADLLVTADSIAQITNGSVAASGGAAIGRSNPAILGTLNSSSTMRVLEQSTWNNNFAIEVGENANSFLNPGSTDAVLSIQSGSRVTTNDCSIGLVRSSISSSIQALAPTTFGEVNVTSDSTFDVSDTLIVGEKANGTLNILSNGQVSAANLIIADGEHSTGAVFVTGQSTLNADNVFVGVEGAGTLNLANSTMNAGSCMIGSSSGIAHVVVDSSTMNSQIQVGGALGQGTLTIRPNGSVNVDNGSVIGINGTLELEGGELRHISANGSLRIDGTLLTSGGSVFLEDETLLTPTSSTETAASTTSFEILEHNGDEFCIPPSGRVVVTETFRGTSSFSGTGMVEFQGFVALGNTGQPMASVTVPNAVLGDDSELIANIYGTQPGIDHDRLVAMDSLTIEGLAIMSLSIGPDAELVPGQQIEIMRLNNLSAAINGTFAGLPEGSTIKHASGFDFSISYVGGDGNDVVLTVLDDDDVLIGDVNLDGIVSLLDVSEFVGRVSTGTFQVEADCNEDGQVDLLDVVPFVDILSG